jgi:hypothetical protein
MASDESRDFSHQEEGNANAHLQMLLRGLRLKADLLVNESAVFRSDFLDQPDPLRV